MLMLAERGVIQLPQMEEVINNQALSPNSSADFSAQYKDSTGREFE